MFEFLFSHQLHPGLRLGSQESPFFSPIKMTPLSQQFLLARPPLRPSPGRLRRNSLPHPGIAYLARLQLGQSCLSLARSVEGTAQMHFRSAQFRPQAPLPLARSRVGGLEMGAHLGLASLQEPRNPSYARPERGTGPAHPLAGNAKGKATLTISLRRTPSKRQGPTLQLQTPTHPAPHRVISSDCSM